MVVRSTTNSFFRGQDMFYFNLPIYTLRFCGDLEHTDASNIKPLLKHLRVKNNDAYRVV